LEKIGDAGSNGTDHDRGRRGKAKTRILTSMNGKKRTESEREYSTPTRKGT